MSEHQDDGGQVSEVGGLEPAGGANDPISPEDATAGYPDSESGGAQEGTAGPDAAPRHDLPEPGDQSSEGDDDAQGV